MPEFPDVAVYVQKIAERAVGRTLTALRLASPFFLRTVQPRPTELAGRTLRDVRRHAKRIVLEFAPRPGEDDACFAVVHLMVAGRFRWIEPAPAKIPGKLGLCAFDFAAPASALSTDTSSGSLIVTEASSKKRASLHLFSSADQLATLDRGGVDIEHASLAEFSAALRNERHTLKRSLTDQTLIGGIGNAYSDEILHAAKLSPLQMSTHLSDAEIERLYSCARAVLWHWRDVIAAEPGFPERVTAFREGMAAHGRYGKACPTCGATIQRIVYADNETNYCAGCQTGGKLLADRSLSRLLGADWPKNLDELENARPAAQLPANPARSTKPTRKKNA